MNLKKGLLAAAAISLGLLSVTTALPTLAQAAVVASSSDAPTYLTQGETIVSFRRILSDGERGRDRDHHDRDRDHDHDRDRDHHDRDRDHNHRAIALPFKQMSNRKTHTDVGLFWREQAACLNLAYE